MHLWEQVRGCDADGWRRSVCAMANECAGEIGADCGLLARKMLIGAWPIMAGYKRAGLSAPPFASSTERLNDQV